MNKYYNIYCDESCHLENDKNKYMVLGGIICPDAEKEEVFQRIKSIKKEFGIHVAEMKWTKVSKGKLSAYKDLINFFFDKDSLRFRAVMVNKEQLNHKAHNSSHDEFYYRMYFLLLEWFLSTSSYYSIYLDIKDTLGIEKITKLRNVLCNSKYDFDQKHIKKVQEVRSHEIALMQIVDILIGAVSYNNNYPEGGNSEAKNELVKLIKGRSKCSLDKTTFLGASKFNMINWEPSDK